MNDRYAKSVILRKNKNGISDDFGLRGSRRSENKFTQNVLSCPNCRHKYFFVLGRRLPLSRDRPPPAIDQLCGVDSLKSAQGEFSYHVQYRVYGV